MEATSLQDICSRLEPLAQRIIGAAGMDLIELKLSGHKNDLHIQITADKPSGGITIGDCAIINKSLVAAIEQENLLPPENFSLELSSPGLDRPLVTRKDFMRFVSQDVHFWLKNEVAGKKELQGTLTQVSQTSLTVSIGRDQKLVLPLDNIIKAKLVI
jgi:ribosome maturation factor RimP